MTTRLPDAEARSRAASDLDRSFLVEAPAGSGKTTLLVARILAWIRSARATLPEIVAITFTEKAAAELRLRVRETVERALGTAGPAERAVLAQALADLELAPIRTIHGFCGDLLRQRPVEAGVDPGFAVADPLQTALLLDETWERWLERAAGDAPPALQEAVALGVSLQTLHELATRLVQDRDLLDGLPAPVPEDGAALNRDARERLRALFAAVPARARGGADRLGRHLEELAAWVGQTEALAEDEQVTALLTELPFRKVSGYGSQGAWGKEPLVRARTELTELGDHVADARAVRLHNLTAALARWLAGFVRAYQTRLRRLGLLDFHDLLAVTRDLLRGRPDVRRDFQRQYRTLLLDEFQDTDPLQLEIAFFLAEDPAGPPAASWETVRLAPGRLFLVGDPKQSIYRFRRADIETYQRAREILAEQGEVLTLATNFRAGGALCEAVNRLFVDQMQPPEDGAYQPAYAPIVPAPGTPAGDGPLLLESPAEAPTPAGVDARRAQEAAGLARLVARAVADGAWTVRDRTASSGQRAPDGGAPAPRRPEARIPGAARPARFGDVVCLFRTLSAAAVYEDAFRVAGVPYRTVGGRHYYARSEVGWALAALTAIEDPYDPVALVATLRSPFFGIPDGVFLAHAAAGGQFSYLTPLPTGSDAVLAAAWRGLADLHAQRTQESAPAIVEALYGATEILATYGLDPHGDQRVANLLRILDTARALEAAGRATFRGLVRWLAAQDAAGFEEGESPVAEEGDDVVRLLTVHGAKGLEFPVVILPDLDWDHRGATPRLVVDRRPVGAELGVSLGKVADWKVETTNVSALVEREERRAEAERLRLFYVATTRARDHLVLPLLFGEPRGFAAFCAPLLDESWTGVRRQRLGGDAPPGPPAAPEPAPVLMPREAWAEARAAIIARGRQATPVLHPGGGTARGTGARLGVLVHAALARAELGDPRAAASAVAAAAATLGESGARVTRARRLVEQALAAPPYRQAASAKRVLRELPVSAVVDGQLVEGVVDLAYQTVDGLAVVEVKLGPADAAAHAQVRAYCRALAVAGQPIAEACLLVVGPESAEAIRVVLP